MNYAVNVVTSKIYDFRNVNYHLILLVNLFTAQTPSV
jgi:hypothetical protein